MNEFLLILSKSWLESITRITLQGSTSIAAIFLITILLKKQSPTLKHLLWLVVMVKFLIMPFVMIPVTLPAQQTPAPKIISGPVNEQTIPILKSGLMSYPSKYSAYSSLPAVQTSSAVAASRPKITIPIPVMLFSAWLFGFFFFMAGICSRSRKYRRDVLAAKTLEDKDFLWLVEEGAKKFRINIPVVKVSESFSCPLACGIFRPILIFPQHVITEFRKEELKTVIYHELAHIKRKDIITNWLQIIVQTFYFFNPLVWYANRQMRLEREQACDDWVLQTGKSDRKTLGSPPWAGQKVVVSKV